MNRDSIQDSTRYIVSEVHHGSILPGKRMEMWRTVYLLNDADIRGGVWCGELSVSGPGVCVAESVYCRGAASVTQNPEYTGQSQNITFGSCFASPDSLTIPAIPFKVRFLSDIYTGQLNLSNAFVYGNVFAHQAIIRNSIVLGGIFCKDELQVEHSMVGTFEANRVTLGNNVSMFFPFASARQAIGLAEPVRVLTFFNVYQGLKQDEDAGEVVYLDDDDLFEIDIPTQANGEGGDTESTQRIICLSMMERILDSQTVQRHLRYNAKFLKHLVLGNNLDPNIKEALFTKPMQELEEILWDLLPSPEMAFLTPASLNISELLARLDLPEDDNGSSRRENTPPE